MSRDIWVETAPYISSKETKKSLAEAKPRVYSIFEGQSFNSYYGYDDLPLVAGQAVKLGWYSQEWPNPELVEQAVTIFEVEFEDQRMADNCRMNGFIMPIQAWFEAIGSNKAFSIDSARGISFSSAAEAEKFLQKKNANQKLGEAGLQIQADQALKLVEALR